jgi:hypothetical protein
LEKYKIDASPPPHHLTNAEVGQINKNLIIEYTTIDEGVIIFKKFQAVQAASRI